MTVMLICIINIWIQYLIFVIVYLVSPSERIMLYTSIIYMYMYLLSQPLFPDIFQIV